VNLFIHRCITLKLEAISKAGNSTPTTTPQSWPEATFQRSKKEK
jgi:hypothetical protein